MKANEREHVSEKIAETGSEQEKENTIERMSKKE